MSDYQLLRQIDTGGMADVFLARRVGSEGFRRLVAAKRIRPSLAADPALLGSFLQEARLGAQLRHPNVVPVLDLVVHDGLPCIVMEFVHGRIASAVARRGSQTGRPLPLALSVALVAQTLEGLAHAHGLADAEGRPLGLVHRDISPQNIMIGFDGVVRLFDFGIAEISRQQFHPRAGLLSGKAAYLSPEQCRGQALDGRSDVFGLGVLLHELMTQTRLFKRASQVLTLKAVAEEPIPLPRSLDPALPEELERAVMRALERQPERRYGSARALADDLQDWLAGCGQPWGPRALARYLEELFGEELQSEREEQQRLLELAEAELPLLPPPAGPLQGTATPWPQSATPAPLPLPELMPTSAPLSPLLRFPDKVAGAVAEASRTPSSEPPSAVPPLAVVASVAAAPRSRPAGEPLAPEGGGATSASASTSPLAVASPEPHVEPPAPLSWLRSLLVATGLATAIVLAAALALSLSTGAGG